jgi:arginine deiminase
MGSIHVTSEIGKLKKVLLHRPGNELLNLTPDTLSSLLFDDIPFLPDAQKEHDAFAKALRDNGVEVVYLEDLMADVIASSDSIRARFIKQFMDEAGINTMKYKQLVGKYLNAITDPKELVLKTMEGIQVGDIYDEKKDFEKTLVDLKNAGVDIITIGQYIQPSKEHLPVSKYYTLEEFEEAIKKLRQRKIDVVVHIINGLPNETEEMMLDTVKYLNNLDIQGIKIHMLHII